MQLRDVQNLLSVDCDMDYLLSRSQRLDVEEFCSERRCPKMNDTPKEIAELVRRKLLCRSGAERVLMGSRMFDVAREMALASFPPGLSEIEIKRRLCRRFYGNEVPVEAFIESLRNSQKGSKNQSGPECTNS